MQNSQPGANSIPLESLKLLTVKLTRYLGDNLDTQGIALPNAPFSLQDEFFFWMRQMGEHAMFLSSGISDAALVVATEKHGNSILTLKERGLQFYAESIATLQGPPIRADQITTTIEWLNRLESWENEIYSVVIFDWIGYVYPSVVEHYIEELRYFRRTLQALAKGEKLELTDILSFWIDVAKDHAAIIGRLLDPIEDPLSKRVLVYSEEFGKLLELRDEVQAMIDLSLFGTSQLNDLFGEIFNGQQQDMVLSVIHPALLAHIIREGNRAIALLESL